MNKIYASITNTVTIIGCNKYFSRLVRFNLLLIIIENVRIMTGNNSPIFAYVLDFFNEALQFGHS